MSGKRFQIICLICFSAAIVVRADQLKEAKVTQIIKDVKLISTGAGPRQAVVSDPVRDGTAVRTGTESRAELTFTDLTITRLGANTIFSFDEGTRQLNLGSGAVLLQVPKNGAAATINHSAFTCGVTGGTVLCEANSVSKKVLVLEGVAHFTSKKYPAEAVDVPAGHMVGLTADGHVAQTQKFNVAVVYKTAHLLTDFPALPNNDLILQTIYVQQQEQTGPGNFVVVSNDTLDKVDQSAAASTQGQTPGETPGTGPTPPPGPSATPSKFGPPPTISSPNPYVITSGTTISTDPSITTNGTTNFGTIFRDTVQDGPVPNFLYGSTRPFDSSVFDTQNNDGSYAVFKFTDLQLAGNPTISTANGGVTNLALVSIGPITSAAPGGVLTFAGIQDVFIGTQNGSITLGPEISFSVPKLELYARGAGSNLSLGSPISNATKVRLFAEGTIQVNADESTQKFKAISGGDFLGGTGTVTAQDITIQSTTSDIRFDASKFPDPASTGSLDLNANGTLDYLIDPTQTGPTNRSSISLAGETINIRSLAPYTFDFSESDSVTFTAGTGGINAANINFVADGPGDISFTSGANIDIGSLEPGGKITTVSAATSFSAAGNVAAGIITTGTTVDVGGLLSVGTLTAGGNITVGNFLQATNINAASSVLNVGDGIIPTVSDPDGAALQHTFNVDSIVSPNGINFSGNQFGGISGLSSGGRLTINATTITFDVATGIAFADFNGADAGAFGGGSPAEGGDGGVFVVNTTGDITAGGNNITATTGVNTAAGIYSGAGGSVTLHSTGGMVAINDIVLVSSDQVASEINPRNRQSASGGTIDLESDLTTGTGIAVSSDGQLLSLLNSNAPGPGGSITLSTKGADIVVNGTVEADRGTITIDQNDPLGPVPQITIDGATLTADTLNINGAGDVDIGLENAVTINVGTLSISAPGFIEYDMNAPTVNAFEASSTAGGDVTMDFNNTLALNGGARFETTVPTGAMVSNGANVTLTEGEDFTNNSNSDYSLLQVTNQGHIGTGGDISVNILGNLTTSRSGGGTAEFQPGDFAMLIQNTNGQIDTGGNINFTLNGDAQVHGLAAIIQNYDESVNPAGHIGTGGNIAATVDGNLTAGYVDMGINNRGGGIIDSGGNVTLTVHGDLTTTGDAGFLVSTRFDNTNGSTTGSMIGSPVTIEVQVDGNVNIGGSLSSTFFNPGSPFSGISNRGSTINGDAIYEWDVGGVPSRFADALIPTGAVTLGGAASFMLLNDGPTAGNPPDIHPPGTIHGNALIQINAASFSSKGIVGADAFVNAAIDAEINNKNGGVIDQNATITFNIGGDITTQDNPGASGNVFFIILNNQNSAASTYGAGSIGSAAAIGITANNISVSGDFDAEIRNQRAGGSPGANGGSIGTDATVTITAASLSVDGQMDAFIQNFDGTSSGSSAGGNIQGNASITLSLSGALTVTGNDANSGGTPGDALFIINNENNPGTSPGGFIGQSASINIQAGSISAAQDFVAQINNYNGGSINTDATIQIGTTGNVTAGSMQVLINNGNGSIGGDADIAMNIGGTATVTNDTTVEIIGNDPTGTASIEFNGGSYSVGGNFRTTIDGSGSVTFTNSDVHANVIKAAVFGPNGSLVIGGSGIHMISADTLLRLYAPGSNGVLDFVSSVTLSSGTAMDLAAKTITIQPTVVVTIAGAGGAANIYTDNPNYSGFGGTNPSNGTFAGNGANAPQPLANAPSFDSPPPAPATATANTAATSNGTIEVSNSSQLLSMVNGATTSPNGKVTVSNNRKFGRSRGKGTTVANDAVKPRALPRTPVVQ